MHEFAITANRAPSSSTGGATVQPRLARAAHEFEAQMLKELLKPMTGKSMLSGDEAQEGNAGANGELSEFASEALGRALSQGGGFGIANRVIQDLSHSGFQCQNANATPALPSNTVINDSQSLK